MDRKETTPTTAEIEAAREWLDGAEHEMAKYPMSAGQADLLSRALDALVRYPGLEIELVGWKVAYAERIKEQERIKAQTDETVAALEARIAELANDAAVLEPGLCEQVEEQRDHVAALEGALAQAVAEAQLHASRISDLEADLRLSQAEVLTLSRNGERAFNERDALEAKLARVRAAAQTIVFMFVADHVEDHASWMERLRGYVKALDAVIADEAVPATPTKDT